MRQVLGPGALGRPRGIGLRRRWERGLRWGIHVNPWLIHVNVKQKPLQYCKVISHQLLKINGKKIKRNKKGIYCKVDVRDPVFPDSARGCYSFSEFTSALTAGCVPPSLAEIAWHQHRKAQFSTSGTRSFLASPCWVGQSRLHRRMWTWSVQLDLESFLRVVCIYIYILNETQHWAKLMEGEGQWVSLPFWENIYERHLPWLKKNVVWPEISIIDFSPPFLY